MRVLMAAALAAMMVVPAGAEDFSKGSEAKGWNNLQGREPARFEAKVVDLVCELTGDCTPDCGAGKRQMGLVRTADDRLLLAAKNAQATFNGATRDLAQFCNQTVTVDGFLVGAEEVTQTKFYMVQLIGTEEDEKLSRASGWTKSWLAENPGMEDKLKEVKNRWFRIDPAVNAQIEQNGWLGLGAKADETFIKDWY